MGCPIGEILEHEHWERWGFPGSASSASGRNIGQDPNIQPYQAFRFLQVLIAKEAAIQQLNAGSTNHLSPIPGLPVCGMGLCRKPQVCVGKQGLPKGLG